MRRVSHAFLRATTWRASCIGSLHTMDPFGPAHALDTLRRPPQRELPEARNGGKAMHSQPPQRWYFSFDGWRREDGDAEFALA
jgi:hypothetical protein